MFELIKRTARSIKRYARNLVKQRYNADGVDFYPENGNTGLQRYFVENQAEIFRGRVPERYQRISDIIPGSRILEIGAAEGTQMLHVAQTKDFAIGYEKMELQYSTAIELKTAWSELGMRVDNCVFKKQDIFEAITNSNRVFDSIDTVFMSRVIYHLRERIPELLNEIAGSQVKYLVLVGCPERESRWRLRGENGDPMGKYAYYASIEGMRELATSIGFETVLEISSESGQDPLIVAERNGVPKQK